MSTFSIKSFKMLNLVILKSLFDSSNVWMGPLGLVLLTIFLFIMSHFFFLFLCLLIFLLNA